MIITSLSMSGGLYIGPDGPVVPQSGSTIMYIDPGNSLSYAGTGDTVNSIGDAAVSGTMSGVTYDAMTAGGVFDFSGSDGIAFGQYDFGTAITLAVWVYPRTKSSINAIMTNTVSSLNPSGFKFEWNSWMSSDLKMLVEAGNGSSGSVPASTTAQVVLNEWQHLVYTLDTTNQIVTMYRNGGSVAVTGTPVAGIGMNQEWYIGQFADDSYHMNALMGEFKVFSGVLNGTQVSTEFNSSKSRYGL